MNLEIIVASTRPVRIGDQVGHWIAEYTKASTGFEVGVADLKEINLPFLDEPAQPISGRYQNDHTKAWSKRIDAADAFVIVTPEYNFTMPPSLLNAIDFLHHEWKYKPVGFVGYGGTGALRAIQTAKLLLVNLSMMPVPVAVNLMGVYATKDSTKFEPTEEHEQAAARMLSELHIWAEALSTMRVK